MSERCRSVPATPRACSRWGLLPTPASPSPLRQSVPPSEAPPTPYDADFAPADPPPALDMDLDSGAPKSASSSARPQPAVSAAVSAGPVSSPLTRELVLQRLRPAPNAHSHRSSASTDDLFLVFDRAGRQDPRALTRLLSKLDFPVRLVLNLR